MFQFWAKKVKFQPIDAEFQDDCESLISSDAKGLQRPETRPKRQLSQCLKVLLCLLLFAVGILLGFGCSRYFDNTDLSCIKHNLLNSPLMDDKDLFYESVVFNGSLFQQNAFRKKAGPEVDAAWKSLGVDYRSAIVPSDKAQSAGLTEAHVQVSEKYGGGFPANVEGLHHLHCLNLLRQSLYYNFEYYHERKEGAFQNDDEILQYHVSHCLDILRQQLMCTADIGVLGQVFWNREQPQAYPDFNTRHKCRNFDAIRNWAEIHQAPEQVPSDYLKPALSLDYIYETIP